MLHFTLHAQLINYIDDEIANAKAGKPAQIIVKVNALTEVQLINKITRRHLKRVFRLI